MKNNIIISYDLIRKVLSLVEYLEESANSLISLLDELERCKAFGKEFRNDLNDELYALVARARKIKEGLVYAAVHHDEILNYDAQLKYSFKKMSEDITKIHAICEQISEPNYFINAEGKLTK